MTERFLTERMVEMRIVGNAFGRHPVEPGVLQGSPVSPILFAIYTSGLIKWVKEYVSEVEGLYFVDSLGLVGSRSDVNHLVSIHERCAAKSIEWASRRGLQFDTAKKEAALFACKLGHRRHRRPKLIPKTRVRNGAIQFNTDETRWLGVWMDAHLTFKEHHNRCMKEARAAEARFRTLTNTYSGFCESVQAIHVACVQAVSLYGRELWWEPTQVGMRDDLQCLLN